MSFLFTIYGQLWNCAASLLRKNKRFSKDFEQRLIPKAWPWNCSPLPLKEQATQTLIWVQAASGGEAWLVHSLALAINQELAESTTSKITLLCTTFTPQGLAVLQKIPHNLDRVHIIPTFFPLDQPKIMQKAFKQAKPALVVLLETELWPGLLRQAKQEDVPVMVCNGRITEKTLRTYLFFKNFWQKIAPTAILATTVQDTERFKQIFPNSHIALMPNIKFDRASIPKAANGASRLRQKMCLPPPSPQNIIFALSSVREEEEPFLSSILADIKSNLPVSNIHMLVAPRHLERVQNWSKILKQLGIQPQLRSKLLNEAFDTKTEQGNTYPQAIIWDTFGDLDELYQIADVVFVGGSLAPLGGQNFMEALARGLVPHVGKHLKNFLWASAELAKDDLLHIHEDTASLTKALIKEIAELQNKEQTAFLLDGQKSKATVLEQFDSWLQERTGGSTQSAKAILKMLESKLKL